MKVILYGIGERYHKLFDFHEFADIGIIKHDIQVVGFSDGNPGVWGQALFYCGKKYRVKSIDMFSQKDYDKIMVTTDVYFNEIRDELAGKGYGKERIFLADAVFGTHPEEISYVPSPSLNGYWMDLYEKEKKAALYFETKGYKKAVICGADALAGRLAGLLKRFSLEISLCTDIGREGNAHNSFRLPEADIVVVTDMERYMETERMLCQKGDIEVISIQELVYKTLKAAERNE